MSSRNIVLLFLLSAVIRAQETLRLDDGRVFKVESVAVEGGLIRAATPFGPLVFPAARLAPATAAEPAATEDAARIRSTATPILLVESDLDADRHAQLATALDLFAAHLKREYGLDDHDLVAAPYRVRAWRRRVDFKAAQERLAPAISKRKGQAFGEGVAGFYAADLGEVHFWDGGDGDRAGARMELAQHELTHLFNALLARRLGLPALPVWLEEGSAVYFSTVIAEEGLVDGRLAEPTDHEASLFEVLRDLDGARPYGLTALLGVPYERFFGREYSWSWALVRDLRQADDGRRWRSLLEALGAGEAKVAAVFGARPADFEKSWRRRLLAAAPRLATGRKRKGERLLEVVTTMAKPAPELARSFRALARSYASVAMNELALAFFEAAWRGGEETAEDRLLAARLRMEEAGAGEDSPWPEAALVDIKRALELDPLSDRARRERAFQLALRGEDEEAGRELGLGLLLAGPDADLESAALQALRLEGEIVGLDALVASRPALARAFARARLLMLQEDGRFGELLTILREKERRDDLDEDQGLMLADLEMLVDRPEEAARLLRAAVASRPDSWFLRPRLARALAALGKSDEIRALRRETAATAKSRGLDLGFILARIDEALAGR